MCSALNMEFMSNSEVSSSPFSNILGRLVRRSMVVRETLTVATVTGRATMPEQIHLNEVAQYISSTTMFLTNKASWRLLAHAATDHIDRWSPTTHSRTSRLQIDKIWVYTVTVVIDNVNQSSILTVISREIISGESSESTSPIVSDADALCATQLLIFGVSTVHSLRGEIFCVTR